MFFSFTLRPSQLRILSSLLVDLAAGLLLAVFTIRDFMVLTVDFVFVTLFLVIAIKAEDILETHD